MQQTDAVSFSNIGTGNTAFFTLKGGKYAVVQKSTGAGTIDLTILSVDGVTTVKTITSMATVAGFANADLPPGQYRFEVSGFTANFLTVCRVPY